MCVFVLTFRTKVTPSSKRIPRSGDAELQRRKQSPSRRAGRIPVIWSKRTQKLTLGVGFKLSLKHKIEVQCYGFLLDFWGASFAKFQHCVSEMTIGVWEQEALLSKSSNHLNRQQGSTTTLQTYLWREAPGLGVLGVIGCPHCVDVTQHLKHNYSSFKKVWETTRE